MKCAHPRLGYTCALTALLFAANPLLVTGLHAQSTSPDWNGAAKLMSFTGQVSVLRDSDPWALNTGDFVQPGQVIVTGADGWALFQVSDGSTFEVFPKSKVIFRANRGDWRDLLEMVLGKIRVKIEHPGGLPNPNKVRTPSAVISVRGTIFGAEVEDDDGTTLVWSEEGQVEVRHLLKVSDPRVLNPGEYIRVFKNEPIAKKMIDKAGLLERAVRTLSDTFYQLALDARNGGVKGAGTATSVPGLPADQKNGNPAPPAPPPPPPPAPPAPPSSSTSH